MADAHANFAATTVATAPSPATSGTSLVVAAGDGAKFPAVPFNATICPAGTQPTTANAEIVRVTAVATDTLTITRTQESTSARTVVVGDQIFAGITAKTLTDVEGFATTAVSGIYGDGSDGNVTISTTVTLTRDMLYDTLTVTSGGTLKPSAFRVSCKTACLVNSGGAITVDGGAASGATAGAAGTGPGATLGTSTAGAAGTATSGTKATNASSSYGGAGGASGAGTFGGTTGASAPAPAASEGSIRSLPNAAIGIHLGSSLTRAGGGAGGSSGGGDNTNTGGAGGGGGGVLVINAKAITNNGTISANGGAGGNTAAGNTGGGGGGGGGLVLINTSATITGSAPTANGGALGTKSGTGVNGSAGSAGSVFVNVWS